MAQRAFLAITVAAGVLLGACGAAVAGTSGGAGLRDLLPRPGEMPEFKPSGPVVSTRSVGRDVLNDPSALIKIDAENLIKDGFVASVGQYEAASTGTRTKGTSNVTRLRSLEFPRLIGQGSACELSL